MNAQEISARVAGYDVTKVNQDLSAARGDSEVVDYCGSPSAADPLIGEMPFHSMGRYVQRPDGSDCAPFYRVRLDAETAEDVAYGDGTTPSEAISRARLAWHEVNNQ